VKDAINGLASDPLPHGYKKNERSPWLSDPQGDYRIMYDISDRMLTVFIIAADK